MPEQRKANERMASNRRALLSPDPLVDEAGRQQMEAIKRIEQAFPADMDPLARDQVVGLLVGQQVLHWMVVQPLPPSADDQASTPPEQPAPRQRPGKGKGIRRAARKEQQAAPARPWQHGDLLTVENAARFTNRHEQTIRNWYRSGALQVLQPAGPGGAVLIPFENLLACLRHQEVGA